MLTKTNICAGLAKLDTLSLSRTQVGNVGLISVGDGEHTAYTRHLRTLNLAQCALVSDRGVRGLAGKREVVTFRKLN